MIIVKLVPNSMVLLKQIPKNVKVTFIVCKWQEEALEFMRMARQQ